MQTDPKIIARFSQFFQLNPDPRWIRDRSLEINLNRLVKQYPNQGEKFWLRYWLESAKTQADALAVQHLRAYLENACYWSAIAAYNDFSTPDLTWWDYWQVARAIASEPVKLFASYDFTRKTLPRTYAQTKLKYAIISRIRAGKQAERASDWGLLQSLSKTAIKTALKKAGIGEPKLSQCFKAWQAFKEVYAPVAVLQNRQLPSPTDAELAGMTQYYNEQRSLSETAISQVEIQKLLTLCIQVVRAINKIEFTRLDVDNSTLKLELAQKSEDLAQQQQQQAIYSQEWEQVKLELSLAIATLSPDARKMLILERGLGWNQTDIGKEFGLKQYQVSRQLSRHKGFLLKTLAQWSQNQTGLTLSDETIAHLSDELDLWLIWYCRTTILHRFLLSTLRQHCTLKQEISLWCCYFGNLPPKTWLSAIAPDFDLTESELEKKVARCHQILQELRGAIASNFHLEETELQEKLTSLKQILQQRLLLWMEKTLSLTPDSVKVTAKPVALLVDTFLLNAPYATFEIEQR